MTRSQLTKAQLGTAPEPGTPSGFHGQVDRRIWEGGKRSWTVDVHIVRVWPSEELRENGAECLELRVIPGNGGEVIATMAASSGMDRFRRGLMLAFRESRENGRPRSAHEWIKRWRGKGMAVRWTLETVPYTRESATTPLWRAFYRAGMHLAALVWDINEGGPAVFERSGKDPLDIESALDDAPGLVPRMEWLAAMSDPERKQLAVVVRDLTCARVEHPGNWSWWAGSSPHRASWFIRRGFTGWREARPAMSFTNSDSMLHVLARRWLKPSSEVARAAGVQGAQMALAV